MVFTTKLKDTLSSSSIEFGNPTAGFGSYIYAGLSILPTQWSLNLVSINIPGSLRATGVILDSSAHAIYVPLSDLTPIGSFISKGNIFGSVCTIAGNLLQCPCNTDSPTARDAFFPRLEITIGSPLKNAKLTLSGSSYMK